MPSPSPAPRSSFPISLIGRKVSKEFRDDGSGLLDRFTGTVTDFHPNLGVGWYTVSYEDGDTEEYNRQQLSKILLPCPSRSHTPWSSRHFAPEFFYFDANGDSRTYASTSGSLPSDFPAVSTMPCRDMDFLTPPFTPRPPRF